MNLADAHRARVILGVVGAAEEPMQPSLQRRLQPRDLILAREDRVRLFVLADLVVEALRDAREIRRERFPDDLEARGIVCVEPDVGAQLSDSLLERHHE